MSTPTLRPYQERDIAELRRRFAEGARAVCYQAPTGSGKTVLFSGLVEGAAARGNKIAILGHRQEIVDQISDALTVLGVDHGLIVAGQPGIDAPVQVASVATLVRRLDRVADTDLLVVDETHHAVASMWRRIIAAAPKAKVLGVTATPERLDGKGLCDVFDTLVIGPTVSELIDQVYLSRFATYAPAHLVDLRNVRTRMGDYATDDLAEAMSSELVIGGAVTEYARLCPGRPAIAFCVDIKHSKLVAERFQAAGFRAAHVDGDTAKDVRRGLIAALGNGEIDVLCNCGLISEGLDVPGVVAVILLRPTKSLALHLQQIGRALRPAPGKDKALILDHAGNSFRFGPPDAPRQWSLNGEDKRERSSGLALQKRCEQCGAVNLLRASECVECGHPFARRNRIEAVHQPALVPIDRLQAMTYWQALQWAGRDESHSSSWRKRAATSAAGSGTCSTQWKIPREARHDPDGNAPAPARRRIFADPTARQEPRPQGGLGVAEARRR